VSPAARPPAAVFLNEGAGSARSARVRRTVDLVRLALDADLHVIATRNAEELEAFLRERIGPYATAVVAGGDGSLGIAFNVALGRDLSLGYIPAGFGNATSHLLRLPREPEDLAAAIAAGNARSLDLIRVDGRLALFAGMGWDAVVAGRYADAGARGLRGWASAIAASAGELVRRYRVRVAVDGAVVHEGPVELLVVGTTPYYGRGMIVNPGARPDAGRLTLRVYPGPAPRLAVEAARWLLHRRPGAPGVPGTAATVESLDDHPVPLQADGDLIGSAPRWTVSLVPRAVRIIGSRA
jgi:diacylglycerol kinase family enzyme